MLRTTRCIKLTTFFALAILLAAPMYAAPATGGVADVVLGTTQVDWVPTSNSPMVSYSLVVSGPQGVVERNFEAGETPTFNLAALAGDVDGSYSWQLTATPELSADSRRLMAEARAAGTTFTPKDLPSRDELIQSGHFRVVDGAVVQPSTSPEPELGIATGGETLSSASEAIGLVNAADVVYNDDVIVTGSLCVGFDCVNGETFGFDTIRLKENNLRIKFEDTSTASGFPTIDWQITINDSASGGASYYRIEDITNSKVPFTIEANTPNNTLYVDQTGRVGIGTNVPVVKAHAADGNTPTLRLDQNTSSGFQAQIWDVAGNEANFFVRDVTGGSRLPFRIRPGAPTSSIDIAASGNVGIGTASPDSSLHIKGQDVELHVEDTNATEGARQVAVYSNNGTVVFKFVDTSDDVGNNWLNGLKTNNNYIITTEGSIGAPLFEITSTGDVTAAGTVSGSSSRSLKENFKPVDGQDVLARVAGLPIQEWEYLADEENRRHLGPFAEDFKAAFGLNGGDDKHINYTDLGGVALAAIQGLHDVVSQKDSEIEALKQSNEDLAQRLARLEERVLDATVSH